MYFTWNASTSTAANLPGNWNDETGTPHTTHYPTDTTGRFDEVFVDIVIDEDHFAIAGMDLSAGEKLASLHIGRNYDSTIGDETTALKIKADKVIIDAQETKDIYIDIVDASSISVRGGSNINLSGDTDVYEAYAGKITTTDFTINSKVYVSYINNQLTDVNQTFDTGTVLPADITVTGGQVTCNVAFSAMDNYGATWTQDADFTAVNNYSGNFAWADGEFTGTASIYGGRFSASMSEAPRKGKLIVVYPSGSVEIDATSDMLCVESIKYVGGSLVPVLNQTLNPYTQSISKCISPQTISTGATVVGESIQLSKFDKLYVIIQTGTIGIGGDINVSAYQSTTLDHTSETLIEFDPELLAIPNANTVTTRVISGTDLADGNISFRLKATAGPANAAVSISYVKLSV